LLSYFGRRVSCAAEAEDLTQDVFERARKSLDSAPIQNAEAFVFRIAVNKVPPFMINSTILFDPNYGWPPSRQVQLQIGKSG
jgi:hypothetical protein